MSPIRRLIALAALFGAGAEPALAAAPPLKGAGAQFCSAALRPGGRIDPAAVQWVMGFIQGRISAEGPSPPHQPIGGPDDIRARLVDYCHAYPRWQVADGAESFFHDAKPRTPAP